MSISRHGGSWDATCQSGLSWHLHHGEADRAPFSPQRDESENFCCKVLGSTLGRQNLVKYHVAGLAGFYGARR